MPEKKRKGSICIKNQLYINFVSYMSSPGK